MKANIIITLVSIKTRETLRELTDTGTAFNQVNMANVPFYHNFPSKRKVIQILVFAHSL